MSNKTRDYGDLRVTMTSVYDRIWWDKKSGARRNVTFWRPRAQGNMRPVGTVSIGDYNDPNGRRASLLVGNNPSGTSKAAVASPLRYELIWKDQKSGASEDGSVWRPVAPSGYVALGDVGVREWNSPSVNEVWCVRSDLVKQAQYGDSSIWDDAKSGASSDIVLWGVLPPSIGVQGAEKIPILADCFRAATGTHTDKPQQNLAQVPTLAIPNQFKPFDSLVPKITPESIPNRGDQFDLMQQCSVTLPFVAFFDVDDTQSLQNIHDPFCELSRSIAWFVEGVWVNYAEGGFDRSQQIVYGVSDTQNEEMTHSAGVSIKSKFGVGLVKFETSLNYQFTYGSSSSFTEYSEKTVTESFNVGGNYAKVLFSKHIWIKALRSNGTFVIRQIEFAATDDVHFSGTSLPPRKGGEGKEAEGQEVAI